MMKKFLAVFLSVLMVLTCIIIPGMVVSAATPEYLDHYNFSVKEGEIFEYQYGSKNTGKVTFDPGAGRISRDIYPFYNPANVTGNGNTGLTAGYEALEIDGVTYDSIGICFKNATCFTPMMEDGKPFELAPGKTYTVDISYAITRNDGTSGGTNYYFSAVGGLMLPCYGTQPEYLTGSIPAWESPLGTPFKADHNEKIPLKTAVTGELKHTTFTFTTKGAPAGGDTSYTYDAAENTYTVTANSAADGTGTDSKVEISNYLQIFFRGTGPVEINFTHLEIKSEDYVPETTVEYIVDGEVAQTETVEQGADYAINYVPANTETERFSGWYTDAEMTSYIADNGAVIAGNDTIRYYGKMLPYENSVTNTLNEEYYNSGRYPSFVDSVYLGSFTSRGKNANGLTSTDESITIVPTAWRSTLIMPAINKDTNEFFVVQPGAEYKVSFTYKINYAGENASTNPKFRFRVGYGVNATNMIYNSAAFLKSGTYQQYKDVIDEGVSEEVTYTENIVIDELDGLPFIGVEVFVLQNTSVTFYEMKVEKIQSEDLSTGEFLVTDSAENRTTYKVEFDYKLNEELTDNIGIGFKTIAEDDMGYPTFVEGENVAIYNITADKEVGEWIHATAFVTTDMQAAVEVKEGTDDVLTALNSKLYAYIIGEDNYSKISVKDVTAKSLGDVVGLGTVYILNENAENASSNQALRYSFSYSSTTGSDIIIDGVTYTVKNRGFIYLNGQGYALGGRYAGDINLTNAKAKDNVFHAEKSTGLEKCWEYENGSLYYSTYISGFAPEDTKELMVRGYITIECDGQTFTLYSDTFNRSVAYMKSLL